MSRAQPERPADASAAARPEVRTVGVAGGGQLARMMVDAAAPLGLEIIVLDPDAECSSAAVAADTIVAPFDSAAGIAELGRRADVVTFEIERINVAALAELERAGVPVRPSSSVLEVIQDKLVQKQFLADHGIPTSAFTALEHGADIAAALPRVWKARRDGYDGRGVSIVRSAADVATLPAGPALAEALVDIDYELAIMVARGRDGEIALYPLTEIEMDPHAHVMQRVIAPATAPDSVADTCRRLAAKVADALDYVGVLALEFFVDRAGAVFVNELSPRPHNSGHYTIEACATSQFEQHLRAVAGLPLGDTALASAAVTFNVLGDPGANGRPRYLGFDHAAAGVYVHSYDKPVVRPGRKMGHVTVLGASREEAIALADRVQPDIRVVSADD
ncbi:MAG: 5-(carboxyamino)imidazole ribonucleotide synthase [Gammaproteobacteria bacterium]